MERILLHLPNSGVMKNQKVCKFLCLPSDEETYCPGPETEDQEENDELVCLDEGSLSRWRNDQGTVVWADTSLKSDISYNVYKLASCHVTQPIINQSLNQTKTILSKLEETLCCN